MASDRHRRAALTLLLCFAGAVLVGLVVYGSRVFDRGLHHFQFVGLGLGGGILTAALRHYGGRAGVFAMAGVFVLIVLSAGSTTAPRLVRDAAGALGLYAAVRIVLASSRPYPRIVVGRFVLWAFAFAIVHLLIFVLLSLYNGIPLDMAAARTPVVFGVLIGAGVGLGYEVAELISGRCAREGDR